MKTTVKHKHKNCMYYLNLFFLQKPIYVRIHIDKFGKLTFPAQVYLVQVQVWVESTNPFLHGTEKSRRRSTIAHHVLIIFEHKSPNFIVHVMCGILRRLGWHGLLAICQMAATVDLDRHGHCQIVGDWPTPEILREKLAWNYSSFQRYTAEVFSIKF